MPANRYECGCKGTVLKVFFTLLLIGCNAGQALAQRNEMPPGYPASLPHDLQTLLDRIKTSSPSPNLLVRLSETYFDIADDFLKDEAERLAAYKSGAKAAEQALQLEETNADAHLFHAINLGSAERLKGITNAAMVVKQVKHCGLRAIELNPRHAQALQMMGGLLMELPWFLGGDEKKAQEYLERAIAADGNFTNARLLVARLYKKQGRNADAKLQLEAVIGADHPHYRFAWERIYKPQAQRLLKELEKGS
jgi:tetratricopeptide (TPR) repeat protein